jgi:DNA-directed RNA polymerase specialized sigma subunit
MDYSSLPTNWFINKMTFNGREIPYDVFNLVPLLLATRPDNELQALMEAAPNEPTDSSLEEIEPLKNAVIDCIEMLSPQDKFIIEAINYEQLTYQELGTRMGISNVHAWRLKNDAFKRLKELLSNHPVIQEYLNHYEE